MAQYSYVRVDFKPLRSYGFIGNLGSCALVSHDGSIDWCCLPRLDSPSVFAAILDPARGGFFRISPAGSLRSVRQEYLHHTNVLKTVFETDKGILEITDWMHMGGFDFVEQEHHRLPAIYRQAQCMEGEAECAVIFEPRLDYARIPMHFAADEQGGITAEGGGEILRLHTTFPLTIRKDGAAGLRRLRAGDAFSCVCAYGNVSAGDLPPAARSLDRTIAYWQRWVTEGEEGAVRVPAQWKDHVHRSCMVLRVLAGGQGIAAAATTSLPEVPGGSDNWDYRFSWMRDTAFTVRALSAVGHLSDAEEFVDWIAGLLIHGGRRPADLQVLYPLHTSALNAEEELSHLRGFLDSKPVRIGNAAASQRQLDLYGEILNTIFVSEALQKKVDDVFGGILRDIVDYVCEIWREADSGIWELRCDPRHYTYSKVMCWVAIDRGLKLAEAHGWHVDTERWARERDAIHAAVMEKGWHEGRGAFVQAFGSEVLDATAILFPLLGFLPADHPYALATLVAVERDLTEGVLVYRSDPHKGKEGAFGFCSFWLVDALARAGRTEEALERFEELLRLGEPLGLYPEEIDPGTKAFLGNFPQAFTHVGLINSAVTLSQSFPDPAGEALQGLT